MSKVNPRAPPSESEEEEYEEIEVEEEEVEEIEVDEEQEEEAINHAHSASKHKHQAHTHSLSPAPPNAVNHASKVAPSSASPATASSGSATSQTTNQSASQQNSAAVTSKSNASPSAATATKVPTTAATSSSHATVSTGARSSHSHPQPIQTQTARPSAYDDDDEDEGEGEGDDDGEDEEVEYYIEEIEEIEEEEEDDDEGLGGGVGGGGGQKETLNNASGVFDVAPADDSFPEELPLLRFETIGWRLEGSKLEITTIRLTDRYMFIGLSQGTVVILDVEGKGELSRVSVSDHAVLDIGADDRSDFIAACDSEGNIIVQNLNEHKDCYKQNFRKPIKCIALHPHYSTLDDRPFLLGSDAGLTLSTKGRFLGTRSTKAILETGKVVSLAWCGATNVIAAAVDGAVLLIDYSTRSIFYTLTRSASSSAGVMPREMSQPANNGASVSLSQYRCCLLWSDSHALYVAWGDWVTSLAIKRKSVEELFQAGGIRSPLSAVIESGFLLQDEPRGRDLPPRRKRAIGIAPFSGDRILMLIGILDNCEGMIRNVEVHVAQKHTGQPEFCGRQNLLKHHAMRYHLVYQPPTDVSQAEFYLTCPSAVIKAVPCNDEDHVNHYISQEKYVEAFEYAKANNTSSVYHVADLLLKSLIAKGRWAVAAHKTPDICGFVRARWEESVRLFDGSSKAYMLAPYLPVSTSTSSSSSFGGDNFSNNKNNKSTNNATSSTAVTATTFDLESTTYEKVLVSCVHNDLAALAVALVRFEGNYRASAIVSALERRFFEVTTEKSSGRNVPDALVKQIAILYVKLLGLEGRYKEAFDVLIKVREKGEIFEFIRRHNLFDKASELLPQLFKIDHTGALKLLEEHIHDKSSEFLGPESVLRRLSNQPPEMLYAYLCLFQKQGSAYLSLSRNNAQRIAQLYIDVDRKAVLPFLKEFAPFLSDSKAILDLCRHNRLVEEQAYLMTRMGRLDDGLKILVQEMKNVRKAVEVVKDFPQDQDQEFLFEKIVGLVKYMYSNSLPAPAAPTSAGGKLTSSTASGGINNQLFINQKDAKKRFVIHTVEGNDTWESIANRYDFTIAEIMSQNKEVAVTSRIVSAKSLVIPFVTSGLLASATPAAMGPASMPPPSRRLRLIEHIVKEGDTWGSITAFYHSVSMAELLEFNASLLPSKDALVVSPAVIASLGNANNGGSTSSKKLFNAINVWAGGEGGARGGNTANRQQFNVVSQPLYPETDTWQSVSVRNNNMSIVSLMMANPSLLTHVPIPISRSANKTVINVPLGILSGDPNSGHGGHTVHTVIPNQTWAEVSAMYFTVCRQPSNTSNAQQAALAGFELMRINPAAAANSKVPLGAKLSIEINLFADLFKAVSDPSVCEDTAINATYLLREIPDGLPLPNVGQYVSNIAASRRRQMDIRMMMLGALQGDIKQMHTKMRHSRTRPIRVDPRSLKNSSTMPSSSGEQAFTTGTDSSPNTGAFDDGPASSNFFSQFRFGGGAAPSTNNGRATNSTNYIVSSPSTYGMKTNGGSKVFGMGRKADIPTATLFCGLCNEHMSCSVVSMIVFKCRHAFHTKCMWDYLVRTDAIRTDDLKISKVDDLELFFDDPMAYFRNGTILSKPIPHCKQCFSVSQQEEEQ